MDEEAAAYNPDEFFAKWPFWLAIDVDALGELTSGAVACRRLPSGTSVLVAFTDEDLAQTFIEREFLVGFEPSPMETIENLQTILWHVALLSSGVIPLRVPRLRDRPSQT